MWGRHSCLPADRNVCPTKLNRFPFCELPVLPTFPRLLLIAERFAPDVGGVARSAARTADALAELGVEVHVLAWTRTLPAGQVDARIAKRPGAADVVVHRLGLFANLDYSLQHTLTLLDDMGLIEARHLMTFNDKSSVF